MLFVIKCIDKADHLNVRMENRPAHVEFLKSYGEQLFAAGPTLNDQDEMNGSVVILDVESEADAQSFCENDPYAKAGLFESVSIAKWKKVLPA